MDGVELHFHALPGVDDGPTTIDDGLDLICCAAADGTGTVVVTPHVRGDFLTDLSDLTERVRELQSAVGAAALPVFLRRGGELGHDMVARLSQRELELIAQGPPHARWLLVEAPFELIDEGFHAATDELRDRGFGIVIAHPERSADVLLDGAQGLRRELERGAIGQVNAGSITGAHGAEVRHAAFELISRGLLRAASSDAHGPTRPPLLGEARAQLIEGGIPAVLCRDVTASCSRRLLAGGISRATLQPA